MRRVALAVAVVAVAASAGLGFMFGRARDNDEGDPREVNVSYKRGPQNEVAAAIDPRNPRILLAGSNSFSETTLRAYTSIDGGATWRSELAPPPPYGKLAGADPAVAIDNRGRHFYAFIASDDVPERPARLYIATRKGPGKPWRTRQETVDSTIGGRAPRSNNDKGAIAVDLSSTSPHTGRVYLGWSRALHWTQPRRSLLSIEISHSEDGGRTWSRPATVTASESESRFGVALGIGRDGSVYVAWVSDSGIFLARSADGVRFRRARRVVAMPLRFLASSRRLLIPAMPTTPQFPLPTVVVDDERRRVIVVYTRIARDGATDVWLTSYDLALRRRVVHRRVHPPDGRARSDQFQAAAAYDRSTHDLWVCYYDTRGDPRRVKTHFTCAVSTDGGAEFGAPVRASSIASNETGPDAAHGYFGREYGDYQAIVAAEGVAHPFWTDSRHLATLGEEIYTTTLRARR